MEICEPVALTKLPRPSHSGGKVHFGSVWALHGQSKKRRQEVCTAIDGDSLNIHEVQNGRPILSRAVPPSATFACAPVSIRRKHEREVLRQTYFAVRDDGLQLRSILTRDSSIHDGQTTNSIEFQNSDSPIINIDVVPLQEERSIVAVQADGSVTVASDDLQHTSTAKIPGSHSARNGQLLVGSILTAKDARKTVLKSREDLSLNIPGRSAVLVAVFRTAPGDQGRSSGAELHYGGWSISMHPRGLHIVHLFSHKLPLVTSESSRRQTDFLPSFASPPSTLVLASSNELRRFDLTRLVPGQLPDMRSSLFGQQDLILLSNGLALVAFQDSFRLLDPEFGVAQATLDLNQTLLRRKRKRSGSELSGTAIEFIFFFKQLHRVLIYSRSHLIACDLKMMESGTDAGLLVNSLGRGKRDIHQRQPPLNLEIGHGSPSAPTMEEWKKARESLIKMERAGNAAGFETVALKFLRIQSRLDEEEARNWQPSVTNLSEAQSDFILTKIFGIEATAAETEQKPRLRLNLVVPKLIRRLSQAGVLSRRQLERALNSDHDSARMRIEPGAIAQSLLRGDPSCKALSAYVEANSGADCQEQGAVVKLLLLHVWTRSLAPLQQSITAAEELSTETIAIAQSEESVSIVQAKEDKFMMCTLMDALTGFGLSNIKSISSVLCTSFSRVEIMGLVQLLRQQMFRSGYPGSILQPREQSAEAQGDPSSREKAKAGSADLIIDAILKILSACLDAIGPLDLLRREESDEFLENVIPDLLSEVSLATQAAEECVDIHGTLRETLRYGQLDMRSKRGAKNRHAEELSSQRPGEVITLYSEEMEDEEAGGRAGMMPLSLHTEDAVSATKVRKGGGQTSKRSLRNTLMLKRRQKGAYSFERLVL